MTINAVGTISAREPANWRDFLKRIYRLTWEHTIGYVSKNTLITFIHGNAQTTWTFVATISVEQKQC